MDIMWSATLKCKFCKTPNVVNVETITYGSLTQAGFFTPDYQYYVDCETCKEHLIVSSVPSTVAIEVQNRCKSNE